MSASKKMEARGGTIRRVLQLIAPYRLLVVLSLALAAVTVVATLYAPVLTGRGVDMILGPGAVDFAGLARLGIQLCLVVFATALCQWLMSVINNRITFQVVRDIRVKAFSHMEQLPLKYIDAHRPGEAISRLTTDVEQFSDGLLMGFTQLFTGVLTILVTLGFMLSIDWRITLVVVVLTPLSFFVARFIAQHTYSMFRVQSETRAEMTGLVEELVGNQHLVRAFAYETRAEERFERINQDLQKCGVRATFYSSLTNPCTRFLNAIVYAAVGVLGALIAIAGGITAGSLSALLQYANQYTKPFNDISSVMTELQNALACAQRVFDLIDETPIRPDAPDARALDPAAAENGSVQFDHVRFGYTPQATLFQDLSLEAKPGQRIALVGPTGCGKTTLVNLLMRFYEINGGCLKIDGHPIDTVTRDSLRANLGMVLQETWLKSGTIAENIAYGKEGATREEAAWAAGEANVADLIEKLPQKYDTMVTDGGVNLSKGQKQLITIARAMLSPAKLLILDEATSNVDTRTELLIRGAMARLMEGRTCFVIANRLTTVRNADLILVVRGGDIVESGRHEELLRRGGFYSEIYNAQFE